MGADQFLQGARDITITGAVLFILWAAYSGKFEWSWQVKRALDEKDKRITQLEAEIVRIREEARLEIIYWRDTTLATARTGGEILETTRAVRRP